MKTLLIVNASLNQDDSHSRQLAAELQAGWLAIHPQGRVIQRDVGAAPPPHLDIETVTAFYTEPDRRDEATQRLIALSDQLVAELQAADEVVIATPMYNFSVPSGLKAWIDLICRVGVTFRYTEHGPEGLLHGKRGLIIATRGGRYAAGAPAAAANHQDPYLRTVLGFVGIDDVTVVAAEGLSAGRDGFEQAQQQLQRCLQVPEAALVD
ncbi:FMN-dependent NADH-azoreductase [Ferrimonas pelagia]|uniref:FMN dependent NADH:quinone oxidoreductase n=1 Tax=Ferrimonas pelagia TaxID=1177826 RepID=A0ABP9EQ41_9GAMM